MIIFVRNKPFPKCRYCGEQLDYYIFGLANEKHSHPECAGIAMADKVFKKLKDEN